jgi:PAS domain S-box-containing protein
MADLVALAISARTSKTALRVSEARAEAVLQASPDAMVVLDRKGCVVRFNAAAEAFFGRPRVEVLRGDFADLFVPEAERESVRAALRGALEGGDEVPDLRLELRVVGATGEIPAELRAFAFPQEEQVLLAAFVRSVRGAAGEDRAEFERLFEARAAPLREALLEMESYAAAVAHELRGPIRVLDAYSQLLSEEMGRDLHPDGQRFLARMRAAVARMADLVRDVMLLARVSSVDLHRERVDLGTVAEAIAAELREQAPERRVTFDIAAPEPAFCDPGLVRLLLDNLLRNAWKFTSGHPTARICFRSLRAGDERAWCVEDDGAGFDPAQIAELFLPFRRLHGASQFEGTGIGLVTARRIVERHGGRVWAEGAVERGARFCFTLPERGEEPRRPT